MLVNKGWAIVDGGPRRGNVPEPPSGVSFVRTGSEATVTWTAPAENGSRSPATAWSRIPAASSVRARPPNVVTGLSEDEGFKYSFTVTATNAIGTSAASDPYPILRPGQLAAPTAVAGDTTATVTVTAPTSGGAASSYTVTANPGGASCEITLPADPLSCQVTGLSNGTEYTFTAVGDNDGGTSNTSDDSDSVTPLAPAPSITFDDVHPTADGFTAQIRDFSNDFNWSTVR